MIETILKGNTKFNAGMKEKYQFKQKLFDFNILPIFGRLCKNYTKENTSVSSIAF